MPDIVPYEPVYLDDILDLSIRAWNPVFPAMKQETPDYVYKAFYPEGWKARQLADVKAVLQDEETKIWVALTEGKTSGFIGLRVHPDNSMGEVYILAVDPDYQRDGIGTRLLEFAFGWMTEQSLAMAMVETGGDRGHRPARNIYESVGFQQLPVARYFKKL